MDRCAVGQAARDAYERMRPQARPMMRDGDRGRGGAQGVTAFPKKHFPVIHHPGDDTPAGHLPVTMMREPVVRAANTDLFGCECVAVRGDIPGASARGCPQGTPSKDAPAKDAAKPAPAAKPAAVAKPAAKPETAAAAAAGGAEPTLIGQFGTWGAYTAMPNGKKVCFALAKPSSSKTNPPNRPRDPAYAFVSTRPAEKVVNEVSIMIGYALKPGSESSLEVGGSAYAMYTQGDGLWIKNAAEEDRMVDAMRKSADVTVKGMSAKGTETTDVFSLKGLSQALDRLAQDCKR